MTHQVLRDYGKEQKENKKWQPKEGETYFYINGCGDIRYCENLMGYFDKWRISQGNCFKTTEEAEEHLENLKTKAELQALADELNNGEEIDWENPNQYKYYLIYYPMTEHIESALADDISSGNIYCIDSDFMEKAIERIEEHRLIEIIRSGV